MKKCLTLQKLVDSSANNPPSTGEKKIVIVDAAEERRQNNKKERQKRVELMKESLESEYKSLLKVGIIKFNHPLREKWDYLIILLSIYNCIELPLDASFNYRRQINSTQIQEPLNNIIDTVFALDILMNFRTSYLNRLTGEEIIDIKSI